MENDYFSVTYYDELGDNKFRDFCFELTSKIYGSRSLVLYPSKGRDKGIDAKKIRTKEKSLIFQYKFREIGRWMLSRNNVQTNIKGEFEKWSKQMATKNNSAECIFITNVKLTPETHKFFETVIKRYENKVGIEYWDFEKLTHYLKNNDNLRDKYFPRGAREELRALKEKYRMLKRRAKISPSEMKLAQQRIQHLFIDKKLKYKYYYAFIDLLAPFYLGKSGIKKRKKLRKLFNINQKDEKNFIIIMKKNKLIDIVGNLCIVNNRIRAVKLQNEMINNDAIDLGAIIKIFL